MNYGRYQIEGHETSQVGKGAMGVVYRAVDPKLRRQVAIKVLHKNHDDDAVRGFFKEAILNASLSHPNILTILDVGEEQGEMYIAMEYLEGKPLSRFGSPLNRNDIVSIAMQVADALDFAHGKGIVHRDIKPANIMVRNDGRAKITDFGVAKGAGDVLQTQSGIIKGTPAYMSPEQVRGERKVDGRSDLFSLGVILYEFAVGTRPFGGEDFGTVFAEVLNKTPVEPWRANESVDRELSAVIMKALQKDPAKRFQNGRELVEALKGTLRQELKLQRSTVLIAASAPAVAILASGAALLSQRAHPVKKAPVATPPEAGPAAAAAVTRSAFLKVRSDPPEAYVYVDGMFKGTTPLNLRLNFGTYKLRLARSGYLSVAASVTLDKAAEYPVSAKLQPE